MKPNIQNYYKSIEKNNSQFIKFDISTILLNAKINKTFNKLLNLSIKYNIEIYIIMNMCRVFQRQLFNLET